MTEYESLMTEYESLMTEYESLMTEYESLVTEYESLMTYGIIDSIVKGLGVIRRNSDTICNIALDGLVTPK